jgi:hypothetical protein
MGQFADKFKNTPAGPEREKLVYEAAIAQGAPKTVPMTINQPNGDQITFQVMPDYLKIDSVFIPMTGPTAERIAKHFNMVLPTAKMEKHIYDVAKQKGGVVSAKPLSGRTTVIDGKVYTGKDVVRDVSRSELSRAFSDLINKDENYQKNKDDLVAGHMKTIVAPSSTSDAKERLWLHGLYDKDGKPIQGGNGLTSHGLDHSEYASGARFLADKYTITFTDKDGNKKTEVRSIAPSGSYVSNKPDKEPSKPPDAPTGYVIAKLPPSVKNEAEQKSKSLLSNNIGYQEKITVNGKEYLAKVEYHFNKTKGKHKGVTLYESKEQNKASSQEITSPKEPSYTPSTPSQSKTRMNILEKMKNFFENIGIS